MESLNYTELASTLLVVSIFSVCLFITLVAFIMDLAFHKSNVKKQLKEMVEDNAQFKKLMMQGDEEFMNYVDKIIKEQSRELEALEKALIKPKYSIGDKILTQDDIKATIVNINPPSHSSANEFEYILKTRKYFNHEAKDLRRYEWQLRLVK